MCEASPCAAVNKLSAVDVRARQLHTRRTHARESEPHALVDIIYGLQKCAEVAACGADHCIIAKKRQERY